MKRLLFTALMLIDICLSASAQEEEIHYYADSKGEALAIRDFIGQKAIIYLFDGTDLFYVI